MEKGLQNCTKSAKNCELDRWADMLRGHESIEDCEVFIFMLYISYSEQYKINHMTPIPKLVPQADAILFNILNLSRK